MDTLMVMKMKALGFEVNCSEIAGFFEN